MSGARDEVPRTWLSMREAMRYVHVGNADIRRAIVQKELPAYQRVRGGGARVYISRDDLDAWVRSWPEYDPLEAGRGGAA